VDETDKQEQVQLELPAEVLYRLLRERSLVACEFRCLNKASSRAGWHALKRSLVDAPKAN